jgi:hypothetical protein
MIKNIKWTEIIQDESEIVKESALYIIPVDNETCRLVYVDDVGERRELSVIGGGSDKNYVYEQTTSESIWTIYHPLNKKVSIGVEDTAGSQIDGTVLVNDGIKVVIQFNFPFSGTAILN